MNDDLTPHNMQVPSIPVLTDIVTRGDKAPPEEVLDESMFTSGEPAEHQSTMEMNADSEAITVYPGMESKNEPVTPKPFSLDEITESLKQENNEPEDKQPEDQDPVERALKTLMPQLETMAREALKIAMLDIKTEQASHKEDAEKDT